MCMHVALPQTDKSIQYPKLCLYLHPILTFTAKGVEAEVVDERVALENASHHIPAINFCLFIKKGNHGLSLTVTKHFSF